MQPWSSPSESPTGATGPTLHHQPKKGNGQTNNQAGRATPGNLPPTVRSEAIAFYQQKWQAVTPFPKRRSSQGRNQGGWTKRPNRKLPLSQPQKLAPGVNGTSKSARGKWRRWPTELANSPCRFFFLRGSHNTCFHRFPSLHLPRKETTTMGPKMFMCPPPDLVGGGGRRVRVEGVSITGITGDVSPLHTFFFFFPATAHTCLKHGKGTHHQTTRGEEVAGVDTMDDHAQRNTHRSPPLGREFKKVGDQTRTTRKVESRSPNPPFSSPPPTDKNKRHGFRKQSQGPLPSITRAAPAANENKLTRL